jgi:hypothetical protein
MGTLGWIAVGLYLVLGAGVLIADTRPHARERAVLKFASNVGLALPQRLAEPIRLRLISRRRNSTIGGMIGAVAATATLLLLAPAATPHDELLNPLFIVAGIFAGAAISLSVSAVRDSAGESSSDRVRYARSHAVELNDYISRGELLLARVPVALAAVALLTVVTLASIGLLSYTSLVALLASVVLSLVAVGTLLAHEVVGRRVVAMANHVESPEELVREDALRAMTIRELAAPPTFLGYYALLMTVNPLLVAPDESARGVLAFVTLAVAIVTVVTAVGMLVSALVVKRQFLRRLWPELATEADNPVGADA